MADSAMTPFQSTEARLEALVVATSALIGELALESVLQRVVQWPPR